MDMKLRPFQGADTDSILELWNRVLPLDAVSRSLFESKILLDENFDSSTFLVAQDDDRIVGFILGIFARKLQLAEHDPEGVRSWITAFAVHPGYRRRGLGARLINEALSLFVESDKEECLISPYAPGYITPGIDVKEYPAAIIFLNKLGFAETANALSMDASLVHFRFPKEAEEKEIELRRNGIVVRSYHRDDILPYLVFMSRHMPFDWQRIARENLKRMHAGLFSPEQITVAVRGEEVVGYCQFDGTHFGPFGVAGPEQGKGIGTVLLARTVERMRIFGLHNAWVMWTDDAAAKVYSKLGFTESRRFAIMSKKLR